ncbi:MAG: gamma carbonic anhydrase family protein [Spirochaetia bacterium]|nr:gamma carbonic anhydrase family protein [Spirochaetia bacterium]
MPYIHPSAVVMGLVEIGEDVSIWPGAVIRGDTNTIRIGRGVNIQDNCTLHVDSQRGLVVGDYSLIGHNVMLHSCTIGRACLVGIGSIVLEGAVIGDGAMITAGCMIRGGKKIPPMALVVQRDGELIIHPGKARPVSTVAGSVGYIEHAKRAQKNIWGPEPAEFEAACIKQAEEILREMNLSQGSGPSISP